MQKAETSNSRLSLELVVKNFIISVVARGEILYIVEDKEYVLKDQRT